MKKSKAAATKSPASFEQLPAHLQHQAVEQKLADYEKTKNPMFLWAAYALVRPLGDWIPAHFLAYLDECVARFAAVKSEQDIARALGFTAIPGKRMGLRECQDLSANAVVRSIEPAKKPGRMRSAVRSRKRSASPKSKRASRN